MRVLGRTISPCLALFVLLTNDLPAQTTPARNGPIVPGHAYAILIGIEEYSGSGPRTLNYATKDTDLFFRHLVTDRGGSLGQKDLSEFISPGTGARKNEILTTLHHIVTAQAGGNDVIYIVITARSQAPLQSDDVFISVAKSLAEKPDSQISLSELHDVLQENRDVRKVVFADLSGEPSAAGWAPLKGRIERRLALDNLTGVLASDSEQGSRDDANLQGGHRVFSYLLISGLESKSGELNGVRIDKNSDGVVSFSEIRDFLEQYVPKYTQNMPALPKMIQKPVRFGDAKARDVQLSDLRRQGLNDFALRRPHSPLLLASNGSFAAVGFPMAEEFQDQPLSPAAEETLKRYSADLKQGNLIEPGGAKEVLEQLKKLISDPKVLSLQSGLLIAALRDQGQEAITRYGTGDRFTVDPRWQEVEAKDDSFDRAAKAFDMVLQLEPDASDRDRIKARQQFCLGRVAMLKGDASEAEKDFVQATNLDRKFAEPYNALGVLHFRAASFGDAVGEFEVAKRIAPVWAYPRHNAALAYIELGKYDQAIHEYSAAIQNTPYYPYLYYNLGVLLQQLNRLREAETQYRKALDFFGREAKDANERAKVWDQAGNTVERDAALFQSELLRRNIAAAEVALGTLLELRDDPTGALNSYLDALKNYPGLVAAAHNLALLRIDSGDLASAVTLLEENLKKDSTFQPSRLALGDTYLRLGRYADADRVYSEGDQRSLAAITGLAKALAGEGKADAALDRLNRAIQDESNAGEVSPRLYAALGDLHESRNNMQAACADYTNAAKRLKKYPEQSDLSSSLKQKLKLCKSRPGK